MEFGSPVAVRRREDCENTSEGKSGIFCGMTKGTPSLLATPVARRLPLQNIEGNHQGSPSLQEEGLKTVSRVRFGEIVKDLSNWSAAGGDSEVEIVGQGILMASFQKGMHFCV
jgi:hypothetical protein